MWKGRHQKKPAVPLYTNSEAIFGTQGPWFKSVVTYQNIYSYPGDPCVEFPLLFWILDFPWVDITQTYGLKVSCWAWNSFCPRTKTPSWPWVIPETSPRRSSKIEFLVRIQDRRVGIRSPVVTSSHSGSWTVTYRGVSISVLLIYFCNFQNHFTINRVPSPCTSRQYEGLFLNLNGRPLFFLVAIHSVVFVPIWDWFEYWVPLFRKCKLYG